jgi:hypothetical protein
MASLPFFRGAQGTLTLRGASAADGQQRLEVTYDQALADWSDPSGLLSVHDPGATVSIAWTPGAPEGPWAVDGRVRGTFVLDTNRFASSAASSWLSNLFSGVRLHFDALSLADLSKVRDAISVDISLQGGTLDFSLWSIFGAHIEGLSLGAGFLDLDVRCRLALQGGGSFEARLPRLRVSLTRGGVDLGDLVSIDGQLAQGIRARVAFRQERTEAWEYVEGAGAVTIAGLPPIQVQARLGRRRLQSGEWRPLFFFFASADLKAQVFPAVVLRQTGAGFGINQVLKGLGSGQGSLRELVTRGPLPSPDRMESWTVPDGDADTTAFVASTWVAPERVGDESVPFPYVAQLNLYLEVGDELVLMAFGQIWLLTSLGDAGGRLAGYPSARGALALYGRQPRLEGYLVLDPNGRMSAPIEPIASALRSVSGEASLLASPDLFRLRIGPLRVQQQALGIFAVDGTFTYCVEVRRGRPIVLLHAALAARYEQRVSVGIGLGPLSVSLAAQVRAGFAIETTFAGGFLPQSKALAVYALARLEAYASLAVSLRIVFDLRIDIGWRWARISIHIHWEKLIQVSIGLYISAGIEAIASEQGLAFDGYASVRVEICGFDFTVGLSFTCGDTALLRTAREEFQQLLTA